MVATAALALAAALAIERFDAPQSYYRFAGDWRFVGIPNFFNVVSNAGFLIVGLMGLAYLFGGEGRSQMAPIRERLPYAVFFAGVALTTFGSASFHLDPLLPDGGLDATGMLWDRLPITVAFMALFAAFVADRVNATAGWILLPLLVVLGIAATLLWYTTFTAGHGDLRFYSLVQAYPAAAIPLICWLFPGRHTHGRYVFHVLVWYGVAKLCEALDVELYELLGETVSGHALKHLVAALAAYAVLAMLRHTAKRG